MTAQFIGIVGILDDKNHWSRILQVLGPFGSYDTALKATDTARLATKDNRIGDEGDTDEVSVGYDVHEVTQ